MIPIVEDIHFAHPTIYGNNLISGSFDNNLKVWDFPTRKVITSFTGDGAINCCAVAPDRLTIVAGEASGHLHFLQLEGV